MKPKLIICFLFALFIAALTPLPAETKAETVKIKDPTAMYRAGDVQVEGIAFTDTRNLNDFDSGGGVGLTYWHWENAGVGFEGKTLDTHHAAFDTLGLNLAGRFPLEFLKVAAITRIGFDWHAEQVGRDPDLTDCDVYAGVGVEKTINRYTIGVELRGVRAAELKPKESLQLALRVGRNF